MNLLHLPRKVAGVVANLAVWSYSFYRCGLIGGFVIGSALEASLRRRGPARAALQVAGYTAVAVASYVLTSAHVV